MKAGSLEIDILANIARLQTDMNRAVGIVDRSMGSVRRATDLAKGALGGLAGALSAAALVNLAKGGLEYASSLGEVAQQLGVTTADLQAYRFAATQTGVSQEKMDASLAKLTRSIGEARGGSAKAQKAFAELGVTTDELSRLDTGDVLREIAGATADMADKSRAGALAVPLMGKAAQQLMPLLNEGKKGIDDYAAAARALGIVLADGDIQKADEAADKLGQLNTVLQAKVGVAVAERTDAIIDMANALFTLADGIGEVGAQMRGEAELMERFGIFGGTVRAAFASRQTLNAMATPEGRQQIDYQEVMDLRDELARVKALNRSGSIVDQFRGGGIANEAQIAKDLRAAEARMQASAKEAHALNAKRAAEDAAKAAAADASKQEVKDAEAEAAAERVLKQTEQERLQLAKARADFDADRSGLERTAELIAAGAKIEETRFRTQQLAAGMTAEAIDARIAAEARLNAVIAQREATDGTALLQEQLVEMVWRGVDAEEARFRIEQERAGVTREQIEARLAAEQRISDEVAARSALEGQVADILARGLQALSDDIDRATSSVDNFLSLTAQIDLDGVFGRSGKALGSLVNSMDQLVERQDAYAKAVRDAGGNALDLQRIERQRARLQINDYANLVGASKQFFKEGTTGYKALQAAETAFRAVELALAFQTAATKIGLIGGVTAAKVASDATMATSDTARAAVEQSNSLATTAVKAVEAVINAIRSLPFPANIAAGAATAALVASLGIAVGGAFGGGSAKPTYSAGKGTVFGDSDAESESIARSIDRLAEVDTLTMRYSSQMLASLRNIEANIGGLTNLIIRTGGVEASGAGVNTGTKLTGIYGGTFNALSKIPVIGGLLGGVGKALFGSKTTIAAQGISAGPQSLADILGAGFDADYFTDAKTKKKTFGLTTSTKFRTQTTAADAELERQFGLIFADFSKAIGAAAVPLGASLDSVQAQLGGFIVDIGRINLKDLTGEEIQGKLSAVFGAAGDRMAQAALPGLERFQQVGEGYFETMVRVASTVEAMNNSFAILGQSARLGVDGAMSLVELFGDIGTAQSAVSDFFEAFYTDAERTSARTGQLTQVINGLGLAMPTTAAGFRALVEAQDLNTDAGQQAYVSLLKLAPMFAEVFGSAEDAAQAAAQAASDAAERAQAIIEERLSLEERLLQVQGNTVELRRRELEVLDPSNRALQQQIWAIEDQATAAADAQRILAEAAAAAEQAAAEAARRAEAITNQRLGLEGRLLQLQGNTAELRRRELAGIDASNRALQLQIWAIEDQAAGADEAARAIEQQRAAQEEAAQAAERLKDAWASIADSLLEEARRIRGVMGDQGGGYASLLARFNDASALARAGDQEAARQLPGLSQSLIEAAKAIASDSGDLARVQGMIAASLEQTASLVGGGTASAAEIAAMVAGSGSSQPAWWDSFIKGQLAGAQSAANDGAVVTELRRTRTEAAEMRAEMRAGLAAIAGHTSKTSRILERVTPDGDAIETREAS